MQNTQTNSTPRFKRWSRAGFAVFASLHRAVSIGVLAVGMCTILLATTAPRAHAATLDSLTVAREVELEAVEVRATQAAPARSAVPPVTVYSRTAAAPLQTLESALRTAPGVDVRERGGHGTQTDISIRGGAFDQTMILLNGIDFTDARTGHQSHQLPIDLSSVGRIELLDALSGVGAYAGAINFRTEPLKPRYLRLEAVGGGDGYAFGNASGAWTGKRLTVFAAGSFRRSDGYRPNTDFRNWNGYSRLTYAARTAGFFDFQAGVSDRAWGSNGFYAAYNPLQWEHTKTALGSLKWIKDFGRLSLSSAISYRKNLDRYDWTRGTALNRHNTDNATAVLRADWSWGRAGMTSIGADYAYAHIFSTNLGRDIVPKGGYMKEDSRHVGNAYLRHAVTFGRLDLNASAGISETSYGSSALWSAGAGYRMGNGIKLEAGAAQSQRLPTFTDLYYTSPAHVNNLDLGPEHATTFHLGAAWSRGHWKASATGFYRNGRDVIDWVWRQDLNKWHSEQQARLDTHGVELAAAYTGRVLTASAGYAYQNSAARRMTAVLDYLHHKATATVTVTFLKDFRFSVTGSFYDRAGSYMIYLSRNEAGNWLTEPRRFQPYALLDARLSWMRGPWQLYVEGTNLTATRYMDFGGLPLPGRWFNGGVVFTL